MMRTGCKPLTMNTFHSGVGNSMSMDIFSETAPSMPQTKRGTQMPTKTRMASLRCLESADKEEESRQPRPVRIHPPTTNMRSYKINQRTLQSPKRCRWRKHPSKWAKEKKEQLRVEPKYFANRPYY
jgi:hypothetical protein